MSSSCLVKSIISLCGNNYRFTLLTDVKFSWLWFTQKRREKLSRHLLSSDSAMSSGKRLVRWVKKKKTSKDSSHSFLSDALSRSRASSSQFLNMLSVFLSRRIFRFLFYSPTSPSSVLRETFSCDGHPFLCHLQVFVWLFKTHTHTNSGLRSVNGRDESGIVQVTRWRSCWREKKQTKSLRRQQGGCTYTTTEWPTWQPWSRDRSRTRRPREDRWRWVHSSRRFEVAGLLSPTGPCRPRRLWPPPPSSSPQDGRLPYGDLPVVAAAV